MNTSLKNPLIAISLTIGALLGFAQLKEPSTPKDEPICRLIVDLPHISTYLAETKGRQAIKTNLRTECLQQQQSAKVWLELLISNPRNDQSVETYKPKSLRSEFSPYVIKFRNFYTSCRPSKESKIFFAKAKARITLKTGQIVELLTISKKSRPLRCSPTTKL